MAEEMSKFWRRVLLFGAGMEESEKARAIGEFLAAIKPRMENRGFAYDKPYHAFRIKAGEISRYFGLGFSFGACALLLHPSASIRHETIEQLFHRVSNAPAAVQRDSGTVSWQWALQKKVPKPNSFSVDRLSKVKKGVEFTERFFVKWVEPFFGDHSNLEAIDRSLNDGRAILRAKFIPDWFEMLGRALIAAKLAGRSDYEALKQEYRRSLRKHGTQYPNPEKLFDALAQILDQEVKR